MSEVDKEEAVKRLKKLQGRLDAERAHIEADKILLQLIGDEDIKSAYENIERWYA